MATNRASRVRRSSSAADGLRLVAGATLVMLSCSCGPAAAETSATEPVVAPPPSVDDADAAPDEDTGTLSADERPSFRHCVLHSGSSHRRASDDVVQETACSLDAECIAVPGQATWDDGFVVLSCQGTQCQCILARALADSAAYTIDFTTVEPCSDGEAARQLFFEKCMVGQELEPEAPDDPTP